jgi:hypothetical protein
MENVNKSPLSKETSWENTRKYAMTAADKNQNHKNKTVRLDTLPNAGSFLPIFNR